MVLYFQLKRGALLLPSTQWVRKSKKVHAKIQKINRCVISLAFYLFHFLICKSYIALHCYIVQYLQKENP